MQQKTQKSASLLQIGGFILISCIILLLVGMWGYKIIFAPDSSSQVVEKTEDSEKDGDNTEEKAGNEQSTDENKESDFSLVPDANANDQSTNQSAGQNGLTGTAAEQKILSMSREEKENLVELVESKDSPIGLRVYVQEIFLAGSIEDFDRSKPIYILGGEGNGSRNLSGNGWGNGMKAAEMSRWIMKDNGDGRWYFDLLEPVQFDFAQSDAPGGYLLWENIRFAKLELAKEGEDWKPSWAYFNPTGPKNRCGVDHPKFPVKG